MSWLLGFGSCLLAQAAAPAAEATPKADPMLQLLNFAPMIAIALLFYLLLLRPQAQEQKKREQLLNTLKKNDRVVTIGGILGTVANISDDGTEVTLKVDDNTRIRVLRSGIQSKLGGSDDNSKSAG